MQGHVGMLEKRCEQNPAGDTGRCFFAGNKKEISFPPA
jgi:hypothetical protein